MQIGEFSKWKFLFCMDNPQSKERQMPIAIFYAIVFELSLAIRMQNAYNGYEEAIVMARTSNVFARVEPEIKEQAESVLNQLGIPMSNAIGMFLRQVVIQRGIPFEMKLSAKKPLVMSELTKEQFDAEIAKGMDDIENGRVYSVEEVYEEMHRSYGI